MAINNVIPINVFIFTFLSYHNLQYLSILFTKNSKIIAHNVKGLRRFASPNKGFAKQRPGLAKCGLSEPWEGA
ncbi:hypothetical protein AGMMS50255_1320 [Spirochaetia bacterium]|nr:hypothetical protein AGMMS50255_1320 [Spirochaetia bacterium]